MNEQNTLSKFESFKTVVSKAELPTWEQLPDIELYMDQVIFLLNQYLGNDTTNPITQSMINNYVKLKVIPAPVKKRYSKIHLAYLIIFCTLKQTLSIASIQKIIPVNEDTVATKNVYDSFLSNRQKAIEHTANIIDKVSKLNKNNSSDILMQISSTANIFKTLTEKIIADDEEKPEK